MGPTLSVATLTRVKKTVDIFLINTINTKDDEWYFFFTRMLLELLLEIPKEVALSIHK